MDTNSAKLRLSADFFLKVKERTLKKSRKYKKSYKFVTVTYFKQRMYVRLWGHLGDFCTNFEKNWRQKNVLVDNRLKLFLSHIHCYYCYTVQHLL